MSSLLDDLELYDINILDIVYQLLSNDSELLQMIEKDSIFKLHIPEENKENPPVIRITGTQIPSDYAENQQLSWYGVIQIDCYSLSDPFIIGTKINQLMKTINFKQSSPVFEFDEDTYLLRDGRRYEGIVITDLDKLVKEKLNNN